MAKSASAATAACCAMNVAGLGRRTGQQNLRQLTRGGQPPAALL